ncbi:PREDICTED: MATH domain and coiled-coil domain-containing protein At3g58250-like [Camelina sativa]|uniref:MATH domain and coiled-coil domain-containing protein At3g58250-like n=1 Tax=Camelina sativa TaxID=90675 RepID=A0ABM0YXL8_CAMSA|nr:PREDICTED: MATH domain and coiled-coil domain-containing protein At3g58250-like [Camelina sativa]
MEKQVAKSFTWVIKKFISVKSEYIYSDVFVVDGCNWRLLAYPKGENKQSDYLSLYLEVADHELLPCGWRRQAKVSFTIPHHVTPKYSIVREAKHLFDQNSVSWGFPTMVHRIILNPCSGLLVNGDLTIVADVDVLEVIGKAEVREETISYMDVKGFQVLSSQTGYINAILSMTETLRRSPKEIAKDELADAYALLEPMNECGFRLDWLEKKLDQVSKKMKKYEAGETQIQEIEQELKDLKLKCSDLEAQLEKEKAEVLAAIAPLLLSDGR